ncbi:hypothetical protein niasHT_012859 [Heterodera trifolii]|uniref:Uncharacterized protein n=1 Tax=Heterodera trifolii TaxID=157864 RepID=A0ABD2KYP3_9BILA
MERNDKLPIEETDKMPTNCEGMPFVSDSPFNFQTGEETVWDDIWLLEESLTFSPSEENDQFSIDRMASMVDGEKCAVEMSTDGNGGENRANFGQMNAMRANRGQIDYNLMFNNLPQQFVMVPNPTVPMPENVPTLPQNPTVSDWQNDENDDNTEPKSSSLTTIMDDLTLVPTFSNQPSASGEQMNGKNDHTVTAEGEEVTVIEATEPPKYKKRQKQTKQIKAQKLKPLKRQKSSKEDQNKRNALENANMPAVGHQNAIQSAIVPQNMPPIGNAIGMPPVNAVELLAEKGTEKGTIGTEEQRQIDFVRYVFDQSLFALRLSPEAFNEPMAQIKKGAKMSDEKAKNHFKKLWKSLNGTNAETAFKRLQLLLAKAKQNANFAITISEIQAQTEFIDNKNASTAIHFNVYLDLMKHTFGQRISAFETLTKVQKRVGILQFFYLRLFGKLISALEAPFHDQFAQKVLSGIRVELEEFELIREGIEFAQFTIRHTIGPLLTEQMDGAGLFQLKPQCFLDIINGIISERNVAQMILEESGKGNLLEQIRATASESKQMNVSATFLHFFDAAIARHCQIIEDQSQNEETKIVNQMIRNVKIYRELFDKVNNFHLQIKGREMAAKNQTMAKALAILAHFLTESLGQMDELLDEWHLWQNEKQ